MTLLAALLLAATPASSLQTVADEVSGTVAARGFEGPVGVYVEGSPAPAARAVGSLVMAALANRKLGPVPVVARDAAEAEQVARTLGVRSLVRLTLSLEPPKLVLRGDALSTWVNFWSGSTPTRSGPAAVLLASTEADAEALAFAGAPPVVTPPPAARPLELTVSVLARLPGLPAALAAFDVDGDRRAEVLALMGDTVFTFSADGKLRNKVELSGARSTRPTREPFGLLSLRDGKLLAWSSRRERPELFAWQQGGWRSTGFADALTLGPVVLTPRPGFASFEPAVSWAGKPVSWPEPLEQLSLAGTLALGVSPLGAAALARGQAPSTRVAGVGSGSALADLDGDGTPEVVTTLARALGEADEVRVFALPAFEALQARGGHLNEGTPAWQHPLSGRAVLATAGDLDGDGAEEALLGTWSNDGTGAVVLLRRVP